MTNIKVLRVVDASNISSAPCKQEQDELKNSRTKFALPRTFTILSFPFSIDESMATYKHKLKNSITPFKNGVCFLNMVKNGPNGPLNRPKKAGNR